MSIKVFLNNIERKTQNLLLSTIDVVLHKIDFKIGITFVYEFTFENNQKSRKSR